MKNLKSYNEFQQIDESKRGARLTVSLLALLSQFNLINNQSTKNNLENKGDFNKVIDPKDLENWKEHAHICNLINKGELEYSDLHKEEKSNLNFNTKPLLSIESDSISDDSKIILQGDKNLTIKISKEKELIELSLEEKLEEDLIELDSFNLEELNIAINKEDKFIDSQIDLDLNFKIDKILHTPELKLNLSPSYFSPSLKVIRLVDDFVKITYDMGDVKIYSTLGVFNKNVSSPDSKYELGVPGSKAIGFQFRF